jgi:uncharacterized protein (TIGR02246 family)
MTKEEVTKLIEIYAKAWETGNANLILTIFTPDATYMDPAEPENIGHKGIKSYWLKKVVGKQKGVHFTLLNVWVDGNTGIAEWRVTFIDVPRNLSIELHEAAIFGLRDGKFSSLREYYKAVKTPL